MRAKEKKRNKQAKRNAFLFGCSYYYFLGTLVSLLVLLSAPHPHPHTVAPQYSVDDLFAAFADVKTRTRLMNVFKSKHGWKAHFKINGAIYKYFQALQNGRLPDDPRPSAAQKTTEEAADPPTPQHQPFTAVELAVPTVPTSRSAVSPLPRAEVSDSSADGCSSYAEPLPQQQRESRPFVNPLFDDGGARSGSDGSGTAGVVAGWEEAIPSAPPPVVVCTRRYAGISNQGATCYLNSLLQSLVHIPYFRAEMYKMRVDDEGGSGGAATSGDDADAAAEQNVRGPSVDDAASGSASGSGSDLPDGKRRRLDGSDEDCGGDRDGDDDDGSVSSSSASECGTEGDGSEARQGGRGIPRALQRLFYDIESIRVSEEERAAKGEDPPAPSEEDRRWPAYSGYQTGRSVSTLGLTTSFGWDQYEVSRQQDIQELLRVLTDSLSERLTKLDPNPHRNFIKKLFMGELVRYSRCLDIKYDSRRSEDFFDVSLDVAGMSCLRESLDAYVKEEVMDGDNKYKVEFPDGRKELHPAARGCRFRKLPPVLMLHLKRFEYDPYTDSQRKVNNRFAFDDEIDLSPYVEGPTTADAAPPAASPGGACPKSPTEGPLITREQTNESFCSAAASPAASGGVGKNIYDLHSVMVHIGSINGGHYICYVRPEGPGTPWIKFNDDHVTAATSQEATADNFGGAGGWGSATTAYLLTYVRRNAVAKLFTPPAESDLSVVRRRFEAETKREEAARAAKEHALHNMTVVAVQADTLRDPRCLRSSIQGLRGAAEVETRRARRRKARGAAAAVAAGGAAGGVSIAMKKTNTLEQLRLGIITELNKQRKAAGVAALDFFLNANNSAGRGRARRTARLWRINDEGRVAGGCLTPIVTLRADAFPADQSTCMGADEYATLKAQSSTKVEAAFNINTYATDMITVAVLVEEVEVGGEAEGGDAAAVATRAPHHVSLLSDSGIMSGAGCLVLIKYYDPYATADVDKMRCVGLLSCELGHTTLGAVLRLVKARAERAGGAREGGGGDGGGYAVFVEESSKKVVGALVEGGYREDMTLAAMLESMSDLLPKPRRTHYNSASYWSYDEPEPAPTPARHELMLIVQACAAEAHVAYLMHTEAAERGLLPRAGSSGSDGPPMGGLPCGGGGGGGGGDSGGTVAGAPPSPPVTPSDLHLVPQSHVGGGIAVGVAVGGGEPPPPRSHANRFVFSCRDFYLDALHRMVVRLEPYPYATRTAGVGGDTLRAALEACGARVAAALTEEALGGAYHQHHHHHRSAAAYAAAASPPVFDTTLRSYETVGVAAEKVARHIRAKYLAVFDRAVREGVAARRAPSAGGGGGGALPARARVQKLLRARIRAETLRFTVHRRAADKPDGSHIPSREYSRFPPEYLKQEDAYPMHGAAAAAAAAAAETAASKRRARRRGCKPASVYHRLYYEVLPLSLGDVEDLRQDEGYVTVLDPPKRAAVRCRSEEEAAAAEEEEEEEVEGVDGASPSPSPPSSPSPIFARGSRFEAAALEGEGGQVGVSVAAGQHYFYSLPAVLQWEVDGHPNGVAQVQRNQHGYLDPGTRATLDVLTEALLMRHDMLACGRPSDVEDGADEEGLEELVEDYVATPLAHMEDKLFVGARGASAGRASTHVLLVYKAKGGKILAAYGPASKESVPGKYLSRSGAIRYLYGYASASYVKPLYRWVLVRVGASGSVPLTMLSEAISRESDRRRYGGFEEDPETAESEEDAAEVCVPVARVAVDRTADGSGSNNSGNGQDCNLAFFGQPFAVLARRSDTVGALRRRVAEYLLGGAGGGDGGCLAGLGSGDLPLYVSDGIDHAVLDEDDELFLSSLARRSHYRELFVCCELPVAAQAAAQETKAKTVAATSSWARRANQGIKFN